MASIKKSFTAFIAASLIASAVGHASDLDLEVCDNSVNEANDGGNALRTYEILCDKDASDGSTIATPIIKTGATFETFCALVESGPWETRGGTVNLLEYIGEDSNEHTIIAPTDAAFAKIQGVVDEVLALETSNNDRYNNIVANWLQLHILPDTYLAEDFDCDGTITSLNLLENNVGIQRQKTKCRGTANTFAQIGGGNIGDADQPTIGDPSSVFATANFPNSLDNTFTTTSVDGGTSISSNIIACNGVIHVVDTVLEPARRVSSYYGGYYNNNYYFNTKGTKGKGNGKAGKAAKYQWYFNRLLEENKAEDAEEFNDADREANRESRRARLESLLIDANGNTEALN